LPSIHILQADLTSLRHQKDIVALLDTYAQDPMGGGEPLSDEVKKRLIPGMRAHPEAYVFLAYRTGQDGGEEAVGLANCFLGFSTFAARPLINIHDLAVTPGARRMGVGKALLDSVCAKAKELGCCKVTLEVRDDNPAAKKLYTDYGFNDGGVPHRFWKIGV
jgi:ribosomal protein S18 acetylase RimI-like enzyme